ncbi:hypothetical protein VTL71DRAFT_4276, partial [Oculimacula yallundae]
MDEMLYSIGLERTNQRPTTVNAAAGLKYALRHSGLYNHPEYILGVDYSRSGLMLAIGEVNTTLGRNVPCVERRFWVRYLERGPCVERRFWVRYLERGEWLLAAC